MREASGILAVIVASTLGAACMGPGAPEPPPLSGDLQRLEAPFGGVLLVAPDHHMGSYDQLMVDPIHVTYARSTKQPHALETDKLRAHLRDATARELVSVDPSKLVTQPGPCVLRMQTAFLDLELADPPSTTSSATHIVASYGAVTLVHELRDSQTGAVLLRYLGRRRAPGGSMLGSGYRWKRLTRTMDKMLEDLQAYLVETVPESRASSGPLSRCGGKIYEGIEARD